MSSRPLVPAVTFVLLTACMSATAVSPRPDLLGTSIRSPAAIRTVNLTPNTQYVNVVGGDTVRFVNGNGEFAWSFNVSPIVSSFDLNQVAPAGAIAQNVRVYVAPDPRYSERADFNQNDRQEARLPAVVR